MPHTSYDQVLNLGATGKKAKLNRLVISVSALALVSAAALTLRAVMTASAAVRSAERVRAAESERWSGLATEYADREANRQRALAAEAARYTGLAQIYAEREANRKRSQAAETARYTGLAIQLAIESGNHDWLPDCISAETLALLPPIGDDSWRAAVARCESR